MATIDILRQIAALASAEADRLAGITPTTPTPDPVITPIVPDTPANVQVHAFGASGSTSQITIPSGVTVAIYFQVPPTMVGQGQASFNEAMAGAGGEQARYDIWISATPGGDPIGAAQGNVQYTGGTIHFKVGTLDPWWVATVLPRGGSAYFNIRNIVPGVTGHVAATYHVTT